MQIPVGRVRFESSGAGRTQDIIAAIQYFFALGSEGSPQGKFYAVAQVFSTSVQYIHGRPIYLVESDKYHPSAI